MMERKEKKLDVQASHRPGGLLPNVEYNSDKSNSDCDDIDSRNQKQTSAKTPDRKFHLKPGKRPEVTSFKTVKGYQKQKSVKAVDEKLQSKPGKESNVKTKRFRGETELKHESLNSFRKSDWGTDSDFEDESDNESEMQASDYSSDMEEINDDKQAIRDLDSDSESDIYESREKVDSKDVHEDMGMKHDSDFDESGDDDSKEVETGSGRALDKQDEYSTLRKELADIPFEDLLKIKEKVGVKTFNKILHGRMEDRPKQKTFKRSNKHKPRETSSKRPVGVLRRKGETKSRIARDPRFDNLSGEFRENHFTKNYSFIEDMKAEERKVVKEEMKQAKNDEKKQELKALLNRMQQEQQVKAMKKKKEDLEKKYREKEKELVREGKTPYFLKKSDKKTLELAMKFKELKQSGRLDKYMSKKRKKVAQKQRKKMPSKP